MSCFMWNFIHKYDAYSFFNIYTFENDRKYDLINETMDIMNKRFLFILFAKWLLCFDLNIGLAKKKSFGIFDFKNIP